MTSLYFSVAFAGLAAAFLVAFVLKHLRIPPDWPARAAALALLFALISFARSLADPVGVPSGQPLVDLAANSLGPLSAASTVAAIVLGFVALSGGEAGTEPARSRLRLGTRWSATAALVIAGAAGGSFAEAMGWPVGRKAFAIAFLFLGVFVSTLRRARLETRSGPSPG